MFVKVDQTDPWDRMSERMVRREAVVETRIALGVGRRGHRSGVTGRAAPKVVTVAQKGHVEGWVVAKVAPARVNYPS